MRHPSIVRPSIVPANLRRGAEIARYVWSTSRHLKAIERGVERGVDVKREGRALVAETAEAGVLFVKMAQFLSARSDIVADPDVREALARMQNEVPDLAPAEPPVVPGVDVEPRPIASASIASVYRGTATADLIGLDGETWPAGTPVAVKRVRAGVRERVAVDLPLLVAVMRLATLADIAGAANMLEIVRECVPMVEGELDLRVEAASQEAARDRLCDADGGVAWLRIPRVLSAGRDVMVSEFVGSRKITDAVPNRALAGRLFSLYFRMVVQAGLVHADPHAGNIGVREDGTMVLYDFGAVVDTADAKPHVAALLRSIATEDVDGSVRALVDMGIIKSDPLSAARLRTAVPKIKSLAADATKDFNAELAKIPEFSGNDNRLFQLTTRYIYVIRALVIVQGILSYHDDQFDARAYLERYQDELADATDVSGWDMATGMARDAMGLPASLKNVQVTVSDLGAVLASEIPAMRAQNRSVTRAGLAALALNVALLATLLLR